MGMKVFTILTLLYSVSQACIVPSTSAGEVSTLFIENDNSEEFILANLSLKNFNESLEISFNEGEKICFRVSGPGTIHLTGNILELENDMDYDDDDDGESEDDMVDELKNLRWTEQQIKQLQNNEDSDDDSDNDDGENENEEDGADGSEEEDEEE